MGVSNFISVEWYYVLVYLSFDQYFAYILDLYSALTFLFQLHRNAWGMEGYFTMLRGKNLCGVSDCAAYPDVLPSNSFLRKSSVVEGSSKMS